MADNPKPRRHFTEVRRREREVPADNTRTNRRFQRTSRRRSTEHPILPDNTRVDAVILATALEQALREAPPMLAGPPRVVTDRELFDRAAIRDASPVTTPLFHLGGELDERTQRRDFKEERRVARDGYMAWTGRAFSPTAIDSISKARLDAANVEAKETDSSNIARGISSIFIPPSVFDAVGNTIDNEDDVANSALAYNRLRQRWATDRQIEASGNLPRRIRGLRSDAEYFRRRNTPGFDPATYDHRADSLEALIPVIARLREARDIQTGNYPRPVYAPEEVVREFRGRRKDGRP